MDFGFGSLLDKFEDHFGRLAAKILVGLVGLAVVAVCGSLIFNNMILPAYALYEQIVSPDKKLQVGSAISTTVQLIGIIYVLYFAVQFWERRKEL